jgi:hypothetical protein
MKTVTETKQGERNMNYEVTYPTMNQLDVRIGALKALQSTKGHLLTLAIIEGHEGHKYKPRGQARVSGKKETWKQIDAISDRIKVLQLEITSLVEGRYVGGGNTGRHPVKVEWFNPGVGRRVLAAHGLGPDQD